MITKISILHLISLRNEEHCQFVTDATAVVVKHQADVLQIKPEFDAMRAAYAIELSLLEIMTKSIVTDSLAELNVKRTGYYRSIIMMLDAYLHHFDPSIVSIAERLVHVFKEYGSMQRKTYSAESAALSKFTAEAKNIYMKDFMALGLDEWIEHLEMANNEFQAAMHKRYEESAGKAEGNMKEARSATDAAYSALCNKLDAYMLITNEARYDAAIKALNAVIEKYSTMLAIRKGKNSAKLDKNQSPVNPA
jgi:hypothetical protein